MKGSTGDVPLKVGGRAWVRLTEIRKQKKGVIKASIVHACASVFGTEIPRAEVVIHALGKGFATCRVHARGVYTDEMTIPTEFLSPVVPPAPKAVIHKDPFEVLNRARGITA